MKKLLTALALPLLLAACGSTGGFGPGVGITPSVEGAQIEVDVTQVVDKETGSSKGLRTEYEITQPNVRFVVAPGSLGITITGYQLTVLDSAGTRFAGSEGQYQRAVTARVLSGYACRASSTDATPIPETDQCDASLKVPYARTVDLGSLVLVNDEVGVASVDEFVNQSCPTLKLNISFTGYDDLNRPIAPLQVQGAPLSVGCNFTITEE